MADDSPSPRCTKCAGIIDLTTNVISCTYFLSNLQKTDTYHEECFDQATDIPLRAQCCTCGKGRAHPYQRLDIFKTTLRAQGLDGNQVLFRTCWYICSLKCGEYIKKQATKEKEKMEPMAHIEMQRICSFCEKLGDRFKRCSRCLRVWYCSPECQKSDWKKHKELCDAMTG